MREDAEQHRRHHRKTCRPYKLIDAAQARWRAVNASHLVALVRTGAVFHKGKLLERIVCGNNVDVDAYHRWVGTAPIHTS